ncbi:MAG: hypothetical protein ACLU6Y_16200 [Ruminococcus sp.]
MILETHTRALEGAALSFAVTVNPSSQQAVTLTGDIDLTGTGILGIGKDSLEKNEDAQKFQGTFGRQ